MFDRPFLSPPASFLSGEVTPGGVQLSELLIL